MQDSVHLIVTDLVKTYKNHRHLREKGNKPSNAVRALDGVSFSLTPGFYGLLGPNGAGKSTLMNIIVGSLQQDSGAVTWNGNPIESLGIYFRRILGYVPQQQTLYDSYTGDRFLRYIAALKEIPKERTKNEIDSAAATVNLTDQLNKRLSAYSGGMKQRLLVAAAIMNNPKLLILDEPMAGLDPKERVHLRNSLSEISKKCIVLMATHIVSDIESSADEVIILKNGVLKDQGRVDELILKYAPGKKLEDVYLSIFEYEDK